MTKKDYKLIAEAISNTVSVCDANQFRTVRHVAENIASALVLENSRFDRARFLDACWVG